MVSSVPSRVDGSLCQPFRLKIGKKGRYLIATKDIKPLELIMTDLPCVVGPPAKTVPVCLECLAPLSPSSPLCPGCSIPLCSSSCFSGPLHKQECCLLSSLLPSVSIDDYSSPHIFYSAIVPLRMWLLKTSSQQMWQKVNFLQPGDEEELLRSQMWKDVANYIQNTLKITEFKGEEVLLMAGIKATNANSLEPSGVSGTGLYPLYPLMNSYCYCNTMYSIDKVTKKMEVRAQRAILAGQEITTRYIVPTMEQPARMNSIWQAWGFICSCERCSDNTELGSMFSAVVCRQEDCSGGYMLPAQPCMLGCKWICDQCEYTVGEREIIDMLDMYKHMIDTTNLTDADQCEKLLVLLQEHLHPGHAYMLRIATQLLQIYSRTKPATRPVLDRQMQLAMDILQVTSLIDPGMTPRRGGILKHLVDVMVSKANMDSSKGVIDKDTLKKKLRTALVLMKEMMQCLKFDTVIANNVNGYL